MVIDKSGNENCAHHQAAGTKQRGFGVVGHLPSAVEERPNRQRSAEKAVDAVFAALWVLNKDNRPTHDAYQAVDQAA